MNEENELKKDNEQLPAENGSGSLPDESKEVKTPSTPKRDAFFAYAKEYMGDDYEDGDEEGNYERLVERMKRSHSNATALAEMLSEDPRLAQAMSDIYQKKRGSAAAFVRYFGKDMLSAEEGSEEYAAIEAAEAERLAEANEMTERAKEYEKNIQETMSEVSAYCEEHGKDEEEFLKLFWEKVIFPILNGRYSKELCAMIDKALSYDQDVKDAERAGEVKGRNMKIDRMRSEKGDGLPKGLSSQGDGDYEPKPGGKGNRLIDMALQA